MTHPTNSTPLSNNTLTLKKRAITAGLVVELDPQEAEILGVDGMDQLDPEQLQQEAEWLASRFDPCEYDWASYSLEEPF